MALSERQRRVAVQILEYLVAHPDAKDTLDGVRHWWLAGGDTVTVDDVRAATADLLARGFIGSWEGSAGLPIFGNGARLLATPQQAVAQYRRETESIH